MLPGVVGLPQLASAVAVNAAARDSVRLLAPAAAGFLTFHKRIRALA